MRVNKLEKEIIYYKKFSIIKKIIIDVFEFIINICTIYFIYFIYIYSNNLIFTIIVALLFYLLLLYTSYKSYIYNIKEISINCNYNLNFIGLKYFKFLNENIPLINCKYNLIKLTQGSANYHLQINYKEKFLYLSSGNIGDEEVFKIYNILKEKFPENDLGQKWKYIIIGNTW
jgi:hypothetical protein